MYLCLCRYLDVVFGRVELNITLRMCRTQGRGAVGKHVLYGGPDEQKGLKMACSLILASSSFPGDPAYSYDLFGYQHMRCTYIHVCGKNTYTHMQQNLKIKKVTPET